MSNMWTAARRPSARSRSHITSGTLVPESQEVPPQHGRFDKNTTFGDPKNLMFAIPCMSFVDIFSPAGEQVELQGSQEQFPPQQCPTSAARLALYGAPPGLVQSPGDVHGQPLTTVVVQGVPRWVTQEHALRLWPADGYNYNVIYVSVDAKKGWKGTSRIFINFATENDARTFHSMWNGQRFPGDARYDRRLVVKPGHRQGFHANMDYWRWKLRTDAGAEYLPAVFFLGRRYTF